MLVAKHIGNDMVLAFKEDGKIFDELSTKIILKNNAVENIKLDDGTTIAIDSLQMPTQEDDALIYCQATNKNAPKRRVKMYHFDTSLS